MVRDYRNNPRGVVYFKVTVVNICQEIIVKWLLIYIHMLQNNIFQS